MERPYLLCFFCIAFHVGVNLMTDLGCFFVVVYFCVYMSVSEEYLRCNKLHIVTKLTLAINALCGSQ